MLDFLYYGFLQEALLIGIILSLSAALLSPFLVLNHQGMIAHGLSHITFTGFVIGLIFSDQPLLIAIPFSIIASMLIQWLTTHVKLPGDVAIGIISSVAFAVGLILVKTSDNFNVSIESLLVGNIFTLRPYDIWISLTIFAVILLFILRYYKTLFLISYDEHYAHFLKINVSKIRYMLGILTALFIVMAVRSIGILLVTSLIIFPAASASRFALSFKRTVIYGIAIALIASFIGITLSHPLNIPASACIVLVHGIVFILSTILGKRGQ